MEKMNTKPIKAKRRIKHRKTETFETSSLPVTNHFDEIKFGITTDLLQYPKPARKDYGNKIKQVLSEIDHLESTEDYSGYDTDFEYETFNLELNEPLGDNDAVEID